MKLLFTVLIFYSSLVMAQTNSQTTDSDGDKIIILDTQKEINIEELNATKAKVEKKVKEKIPPKDIDNDRTK